MKKLCPLALAASLFFTSCATLFAPKRNPLSITSQPKGAAVYINGFRRGTTPLELSLKPDRTYVIAFRKKGYGHVTRVVNTKVGAGWIVLDVIGGFIPVVVDAATGNWKKLDQDAVNAALEKQGAVSSAPAAAG